MVRSAKVWMLLKEPFFPLHRVVSVNGICICIWDVGVCGEDDVWGGGDISLVSVSMEESIRSMLLGLEQAVVEVVQLA